MNKYQLERMLKTKWGENDEGAIIETAIKIALENPDKVGAYTRINDHISYLLKNVYRYKNIQN
jgi:hypothetical protein